MTVETASWINELNPALPSINDLKREAPQHFGLIKQVLQNQFPNFGTAAMNATVAELNYMVGVTGLVQPQIDALVNNKADKAGETYTGAHDFTGATITADTKPLGTATNELATTAFVAATGLSSALPGQTGNAGKTIRTDGTAAFWGFAELTHVPISTNTVAAPGNYYDIRANGITLTIPATFVDGDPVGFGCSGGVFPATVDWTTNKLKGRTPGVMTLTGANNHAVCVFANPTDGFMEV